MKKTITGLIVTLLLVQACPALAAPIFEGTVEPVTSYPLVYDGYIPPDVVEVNGVKYMWNSMMSTCHPVKYDPATYDFFMEIGNGAYDCIYTGEYYVVRPAYFDFSFRGDKVNNGYLEIYNTDFELVNKPNFESYVYRIGYYNGTVYCITRRSGVWKSTDMVNWASANIGEFADQLGNVAYKFEPVANSNPIKKISVAGSEFYPIAFENGRTEFNISYFVGGVFDSFPSTLLFSNDSIYPVIVNYDHYYNDIWLKEPWVYEYGDDLVIDWYLRDRPGTSYRLRTPKQPIYDALAAIKNAPYVRVDNEILGFEQPPVTESDRTLVPMRFLFEKLGAEVTWDEATETATARNASTAINFSIDNTTATVNGAATTMDVPARLVGDKTMVPLRFLSEELGYTVEWDEATRMATIVTEDSWENTLALSAPTPKRVQEF